MQTLGRVYSSISISAAAIKVTKAVSALTRDGLCTHITRDLATSAVREDGSLTTYARQSTQALPENAIE